MTSKLSARSFAIALATLLLLAAALLWLPLPERGLPLAGSLPPGGDFVVQGADGPVALKDYRGKAVLLYFGYTYCPDICPTALAAHAEALSLLSPQEAARVAVVFVSVDPERDTLAHLKEYAAFFHPSFIGATANAATLQVLARRYGVFYARQAAGPGGNYSVDHTADTWLIGADGHLLERLPHGTAATTTANALRRALNARS